MWLLEPAGGSPLAVLFADISNPPATVDIDPFEIRAITAAKRGERNAYDYLVTKYGKRVLGVALGLVRNRQDAEDLAQDAFVRAFESLSRFREGEPFGPWVYRIVTNLALDLLRQKARRIEEVTDWIDEAAANGGPEVDRQSRETARAVDRAIQALPEMQRVVARLYLVEEFSHAEIASMVSLSEGTVRSHLWHARTKLKEALRGLR